MNRKLKYTQTNDAYNICNHVIFLKNILEYLNDSR